MNRRRALRVTAGVLVATVAGCTRTGSRQSESGATLDDARAALERYEHPEAAREDGYELMGPCVEELGTPFADSTADRLSYDRPQTLFYTRADEAYELAGVEWFVPADGVTEPPRLFAGDSRRTLEGPMGGHYEAQPRHYGLHAWLFAENPEGVFARTNPEVSCSE